MDSYINLMKVMLLSPFEVTNSLWLVNRPRWCGVSVPRSNTWIAYNEVLGFLRFRFGNEASYQCLHSPTFIKWYNHCSHWHR